MNVALLTAAGRGTRMHNEVPKQFIHIHEKPIILYTMEAFERHPEIDGILVVGLPGWAEILWAYAKQLHIDKFKWFVEGGATGQASIKNGLLELRKHLRDDDVVLVHDGNRPMVGQDVITECLATQRTYGDAVACIPCVEAVFQSEDGVASTTSIPRETLYRTQTPHGYTLGKLLWAHERAERLSIDGTAASCVLMSRLGETVHFCRGSETNLKITTQEDIEIFKALLEAGGRAHV